MSTAVDSLLSILDLEQLEHNLYRGMSPQVGWQRVYGGLVIGQALVAASRTVKDRPVHSMHGYFLRPGDPGIPIIYEVDRIRDGRGFTTRRVVAIQHGKAIFSMAASFQVREESLEHQIAMPDVPMPEDLPGEAEMQAYFLETAPENVRRYWRRERPVELRPVNLQHYHSREKFPPVQHVWIRTTGRLPDDQSLHDCALGYASDMTLLDTALFPHGRSVFDRSLQAASLDHAMWFHRPFRADEWLLYAQDSPSTGGARGFTRGLVFRRDGTLVASTAQEGLLRLQEEFPAAD